MKLLSDIGGQLGILCGMSVISMTEIVFTPDSGCSSLFYWHSLNEFSNFIVSVGNEAIKF